MQESVIVGHQQIARSPSVRVGEFSVIKTWLHERIYGLGRKFSAYGTHRNWIHFCKYGLGVTQDGCLKYGMRLQHARPKSSAVVS